MIDKTQLASDLFQDVGWAVVKPLYGIFLDGKLLNFRDKNDQFFLTKNRAIFYLNNYTVTLQKYLSYMAPPTGLDRDDPEFFMADIHQRVCQGDAKIDYELAVKELIKDGRLEIKTI